MVSVACFVLLKPVFADISNRCFEIAYAAGLVQAVVFEGAWKALCQLELHSCQFSSTAEPRKRCDIPC